MSKSAVIIGVTVAAVAVTVGGYFAYKAYKAKLDANANAQSPNNPDNWGSWLGGLFGDISSIFTTGGTSHETNGDNTNGDPTAGLGTYGDGLDELFGTFGGNP